MSLDDLKDNMQKTVEATKRSFNTIRTGRANPALLDRIVVDYYGSQMPLKALANINTPDSSTIAIQPFDRTSMGMIERAISMSDLGLTPNNNGEIIRLNIPTLTSERRKELVKLAGKLAEEGRVALRNIRRDAVDSVRTQEKIHEISEDESLSLQKKIQEITNQYTKIIDNLLSEKENDITTV